MTEFNLTLEERSKFESLLAEYANAEMDCIRASGRRHDALHRVLDYVNGRTALQIASGYQRGVVEGMSREEVAMPSVLDEVHTIPDDVPTGTTMAVPFTTNELEAGAMHYKHDAPVDCCQCGVCCTARALKSIGKPATLLPPALRDEELPHPHGPLDPAQR